jgi:hypothetical protein
MYKIFTFLVFLFLLQGCGGNDDKSSNGGAKGKQKALAVDAIIVESVSLNQELTISGTLLPSEEVDLKANAFRKPMNS